MRAGLISLHVAALTRRLSPLIVAFDHGKVPLHV